MLYFTRTNTQPTSMFNKLIENKKIGGINSLFWKDGNILHQESTGYKDLITKELMTLNTLFRISSMTKPITSVLSLILWEEGKLDLNDPISKWFPQFEKMKVLNTTTGILEDARSRITVLDLLTQRAGFTYSEFHKGPLQAQYRKALGGDIDSNLSNEEWINNLSSLPLVSQPGELFHYGRSTDLLGILIASIEGKSLGKVLAEKIFTPLGMKDTFFEVPHEKKNRCAANMGFDEMGTLVNLETVPLNMALKNRVEGMEYESGGQGLWSTIGDYLKFARLFVEKGSSEGISILKPETVEMMCTNQLTNLQREQSTLMGSPIFIEHYGFGFGVAVAIKDNKFGYIPCSGTIGSVGWPGAYGGWWSANPKVKTIAVFLTHSMTVPDQLAMGIGLELYEAIDTFSTFCRDHSEVRN